MFIQSGATDVMNINDFKSLDIPYRRVNMLGKYSPGDDYGAEYIWDETSTTSDNDNTVIKLNKYEIGRYEKLTTSLQGLVSSALEIDKIVQSPKAYCSYISNSNMTLTTSFQSIVNWTEISTPLNISESNGVFSPLVEGVYYFTLERIYLNYDQSPTQPITLYIEMRKNSNIVFERNAIISSATKSTEPATISFSTNAIISANKDDEFEFRFRAMMDGSNPLDTRLKLIQISAHKIDDLN